MQGLIKQWNKFLERDMTPDYLIRIGIRELLKEKIKFENSFSPEARKEKLISFIRELKKSPIAISIDKANEQHYEVPTEFFKLVMGDYMKYSCCMWDKDTKTLTQAEKKMLDLTIEKAQIKNGDNVLELGCGWGSLSLYIAGKFPQSNLTVVSNSKTQKEYIDSEAQKRNLKNLEVITCDMNEFYINKKFNRVISVEMFEHMRNYEKLLKKISGFMVKGATLFVHIFTHKEFAYYYDTEDEMDWIAKHFFTGGIMPSDNLLLYFQDDLKIENHWVINGRHYQKTAEAWLFNMKRNKNQVMKILEKTYGKGESKKWWVYWKVFFMACAELWGYNNGNEWLVSHYLFEKK